MKQASVVTIGNEILAGLTIDTNSAYLSRQLQNISIPVVSSFTIGDSIDAVVQKLKQASTESDVIIITGGLGPTDDDVTRQAVAEYLDSKLVLHENILDKIRRYFADKDLLMPQKNRIQAYIPDGAKVLENNLGTAPGFWAQKNGKLYIVLPGVPIEMERMFEDILPELRKYAGSQAIAIRRLKCFGAGESAVAEMLGDIMQRGRNPLVNCTVHAGVITLHIIAKADELSKAQQMAEVDEKFLLAKLGDLVYGRDDQSLADVVAEKLKQQGKTLSVAESCTAGLLCKLLTDKSGASEFFTHGWITYSNEAKINELSVPTGLIEEHGAVSEEVALAMARGSRRKAGTDYAIGITGIAGPTGGTELKPVGLVYIAIDSEDGGQVKRCFFTHNRQFIRLRAAQTALNMLRLRLNN